MWIYSSIFTSAAHTAATVWPWLTHCMSVELKVVCTYRWAALTSCGWMWVGDLLEVKVHIFPLSDVQTSRMQLPKKKAQTDVICKDTSRTLSESSGKHLLLIINNYVLPFRKYSLSLFSWCRCFSFLYSQITRHLKRLLSSSSPT